MWKILKTPAMSRWDIPNRDIDIHNKKIKESANDVFDKTKWKIENEKTISINKSVYKLKELQKINYTKSLFSVYKVHNWIKSSILFLTFISKDKLKKFEDWEKIDVKNEDIYKKEIVDFLFNFLEKNV